MPHPWYLISSHGVVLAYIARNPDATLREMSEKLDLTERRISQIVRDLADAAYLRVEHVGRRSRYTIYEMAVMRHPFLQHVRLGDLLDLLVRQPGSGDS